MKYTKEQRIDIGRQVFTYEISHTDAEKKYGIMKSCIDQYIQDYKNANGIPTETRASGSERPALVKQELPLDIEPFKAMSKEELIDERIRAKVNETRAKRIRSERGWCRQGIPCQVSFSRISLAECEDLPGHRAYPFGSVCP